MDRQLLERMIGAVVLIGLLVIVAPALLDGDGDRGKEQLPTATPASGVNESGKRTHTMRLNEAADSPPVARELAPEARQPPPPAVVAIEPPPAPAEPPTREPAPPTAPRVEETAQAPVTPDTSERDVADEVVPAPAPATVPPVAAPVPAEGWAVQLGSFSQRENAQRLAAEVEDKGFATFLMPLEKDGATLYRVRVGPRPDRGEAEKLAVKLATAGYMGRPVPQNPES